MKLLSLTAAAALLLTAAPAQAQWFGNAAESSAQAYCASRASGRDHNQANNDALKVMVDMGPHGFGGIATALFSGRQQVQTMDYLARQMCPEYF